jgi:ankyrin repeat protein
MYTPLFTACEKGRDTIVRLLLQYGAKSIEEDAR